MFKVFNLCNKS